MITKIAFIAHPARDLERSKEFFGDVLGLRYDGGDSGWGRWAEYTTPGGGTIALDTYAPEFSGTDARPYVALETDDIEGDVRRLRERGVEIVRDVWVNRSPEGREVCRMAVLLDPEGNAFMLHETAGWRRDERPIA